jgi:hypothetical protein
VSGDVYIYFYPPTTLPSNVVIVKNAPAITGTAMAPEIEVKSNPYQIVHSYEQFSQIGYRIDQDAYVTVKLLPPGISDTNSSQAVTVVNNQLTAANNGSGQPIDHIVEWTGYNVADTNNILISAEGDYTFIIQAISVQTGSTATWRGAIRLYQ